MGRQSLNKTKGILDLGYNPCCTVLKKGH